MATTAKVQYDTPEARRKARAVLDDAYAGREYKVTDTQAKFGLIDFLVEGEEFRHRVEVKCRGADKPKYTLAYMERHALKIGRKKLDFMIDRSRQERSIPILIIQTFDRYLLGMDVRRVRQVAFITTMKRKDRPLEYPEPAYGIWPKDMSVWPQDIIREYPPGAWNVWTDYAPR